MEKILEIKDQDIFQKIINNIIEELCMRKVVYDIEISSAIIEKAKSDLRAIIVSNEFNIEKISDELNKIEEERKSEFLINLITERRNELVFGSVLEHNTCIGEVMTDFDWSSNLVLGTSQLKSLNYSVFQLIATTVGTDKLIKSKVFDMKKDVLKKLIDKLESIQ